MTKIAVITKSPSKTNYSKYFPFPFDLYTLTSQDLKKVLVKDVDISINLKDYDYTILVGSEALKYYSKVTSVNDYTGKKVPGGNRAPDYQGFIACINPSVLIFKPEYKDSFDKSIESIVSIVAGIERKVSEVHYVTECDSETVLEEYLEQRLKEAQAPVNEKLNLAIDTETNSFSYKKGFIIGLCLSHKPNFGMYIESGVISQKSLDLLQEIIDHHNYRIIGHNLKFDMHFLENSFGLNFDKAFSESRAHDTMLIHYTLDERTGTHGLKNLALKYTDMGNYDSELDEWKSAYCKTKGIANEDFTYDLIPWDLISKYGCLTKESKVLLEDGTWAEIGTIVAEKYSGNVMSLNESTNTFEPKKVTGWYKNNHPSKQWYKVEFNCGVDPTQAKTNSRWGTLNGPAFTPDHRMLTDHGYIEIADIDPSKHKMVSNELALTDDGLQVVLASLLADGTLQSKNGVGAGIYLSQSKNHRSNFEFKVASLGGIGGLYKETEPRNLNQNGQLNFYSNYTKQFSDMYQELPTRDTSKNYKLIFTKDLAAKLDVRALACWYMDDGNLPSVGALPRIWTTTSSSEERELMLDWLAGLGVEAKFYEQGENAFIQILNYNYFFELIAPYMNKDMLYKIEGFTGDTCTYEWDFERKNPYMQTIVSIQQWTPPESRRGYQTSWCIDVEDNHNFVTQVGVVHNCMDADATIRLFHFMYPKLENNPKLFSVYTNILMPGSKFLCEVEENGVPVSKVRLEAAKQVVMTHISEAYKKLYTFASVREFERVNNKEFNPDSPVQLRQLLFDFEGLSPTGIVTDTGADSTNAEALLLLGEHNPLASVILEIRKYQKLLSTYIKKMEEHLDHDGRLRTGFNLQTTTSGRLSSSGNINLQQLPRDDGLVKGCIQARKGYKIVAVDKLPC